MKQVAQIEKSMMRDDIPDFKAGDTVRVHVKIKEGDKERVQVFQGTVISRRGSGVSETFTVRKISSGIGVERIFPLHSPNIAKIQRTRMGKVRRAKLFYLRDLTGKSARIEEKLEEKSAEDVKKETKQKKTKKARKAAKAEKAEETKKVETAPAEENTEETEEIKAEE